MKGCPVLHWLLLWSLFIARQPSLHPSGIAITACHRVDEHDNPDYVQGVGARVLEPISSKCVSLFAD